MDGNIERQQNRINFINQPKLSIHDVDQKYNERRLNLVSQIENFIAAHELFKDKEVSIEFSHEGVSSLVCFIETNNEKKVLKIPLSETPVEGEAQFLKAWEEVGVCVPHVFGEGAIADSRYVLMNFIDAPSIVKANNGYEEIIKNGGFNDMGRTLATMHSPKGNGYGRIIEGKPQYSEFKEWLLGKDLEKRIKTVQEKNLLGNEHGSISAVIETLIAHSERNPDSTYCHNDFSPDNVLATEPITVFDPDPILNQGIIDIGKSILICNAMAGTSEAGEQLKEGYFSINPRFDSKALQASIILAAYIKFPYWHKKDKTKKMEFVRQYLAQEVHLLCG